MIKAQDEVHAISLEQSEQTSLARLYRIKGMEAVGKQEELEKETLCEHWNRAVESNGLEK